MSKYYREKETDMIEWLLRKLGFLSEKHKHIHVVKETAVEVPVVKEDSLPVQQEAPVSETKPTVKKPRKPRSKKKTTK